MAASGARCALRSIQALRRLAAAPLSASAALRLEQRATHAAPPLEAHASAAALRAHVVDAPRADVLRVDDVTHTDGLIVSNYGGVQPCSIGAVLTGACACTLGSSSFTAARAPSGAGAPLRARAARQLRGGAHACAAARTRAACAPALRPCFPPRAALGVERVLPLSADAPRTDAMRPGRMYPYFTLSHAAVIEQAERAEQTKSKPWITQGACASAFAAARGSGARQRRVRAAERALHSRFAASLPARIARGAPDAALIPSPHPGLALVLAGCMLPTYSECAPEPFLDLYFTRTSNNPKKPYIDKFEGKEHGLNTVFMKEFLAFHSPRFRQHGEGELKGKAWEDLVLSLPDGSFKRASPKNQDLINKVKKKRRLEEGAEATEAGGNAPSQEAATAAACV